MSSDSKVCSQCKESRPSDAYSGAQLKKKGKRVCKYCIDGTPAPAGNSDGASSSNSTTIASSSSAASSSTIRAPPVRPHQPLAAGTFPPSSHFPDSAPIALENEIAYYTYTNEAQLPLLTKLIEKDLSEPYSVFTYRYFLNFWPHLTFLAMLKDECIGCIVCRLTRDKQGQARGYIAMLAVSTLYRNKRIGSKLVQLVIHAMKAANADLVVLEAEVTNKGALALYEKLNFVRETRLVKYYLSGSDAFRLKLWLKPLGDNGEDISSEDTLHEAKAD